MTENGTVNQYKYEEMANKVLRTDKRLLDEGSFLNRNDIDTNPHSLKGVISSKDFGSNIRNTIKNDTEDTDDETKQLRESIESSLNALNDNKNISKKSKSKLKSTKVKKPTSLNGTIEILNYVPSTESTLYSYNQILKWCDDILDNDLPDDVIESLADILIEILKSNDKNTLNKKKLVEESINKNIPDDQFQLLYSLVNSLIDYNQNLNLDDQRISDGLGIIMSSDDENDDVEDNDTEDEDLNSDSEDEKDEDDNNDMNFVNQDVDDSDNIVLLTNTEDPNTIISFDSTNIDKYWISKQLSKYQPKIDEYKHSDISKIIFNELEKVTNKIIDLRTFEKKILNIPDFEMNQLYYILVQNHEIIYYKLKLAQSDDESEKSQILVKLQSLKNNNKRKLDSDNDNDHNSNPLAESKKKKISSSTTTAKSSSSSDNYPRNIDLNNLVFTQGSKLMTISQFDLPKGSFKRTKKSWEEIHIPPPEKAPIASDEVAIQISELPEWAQSVFPSNEMTTLNRIQSKVYPSAFLADNNILMCAPTGAGKTNVAMLTVLRTLSKFRNSNGKFQLNNFKIVYIAPLKALVQEQVREFDRRLSHFGITVNELTGDSNLTKHQIETTQILVTTPEKWDVITRKNNDASYINLVKLVIIDEIHLLHDERGPVLESIVARTMKNIDDNVDYNVRFVGLSATLPNYKDVAHFLRVESNGLYYFDSSFRPCPLAQQFVGITEKKAFKKYEAMNDVCYEKVIENLSENNQVIIFVHSRKETAKTAKWLANKLSENKDRYKLLKISDGVREILKSEASNSKNKNLKQVLPMGFGIHHAGMNRDDRQTAEDLFAEGHIKVLVSTATLAWGVNLPAHTVIIKGTSIYSPEKGTWVDLSPQDILQMLGRAGRPRYDTHGDGIIITSQDQIKYYLAVLNQQLPIESQMYSKLADNINAEIVAGSIKSLKECIDWMGYTYLYVRMLHSREIYYVGPQYDNDLDLIERRKDLAYSSFLILAKNGLIKYNYLKDLVVPTVLGKISSFYYISYTNMKNFTDQIKPHFGEIELFRLFGTSEEFKYIPVRKEEKGELQKLLEKAPIPINEDVEDPLSKINVLLQAYISGLKLDGFALMADMVYVSQSAGRLFRALYDLCLKKGWAKLVKILLNICKMIENKLWLTSTPLRQYPNVPPEIINIAERSMTPWKYYLTLTNPSHVIKALKAEKFGNLAYELVSKFPQLDIEASVKPITPSLIQLDLEIFPRWKWDTEIHGFTQSFTLLVEDCDGEKILYSDQFFVRKDYINEIHYISFFIPLSENEQPNYFVSLISDKWLFCEKKIPVMLTNMKVPKKFPALTPVIESDLVPVSDVGIKEFTTVFPFKYFNKFQSQVFDSIYNNDENVLFATSKGNGKTDIALLSLLKLWKDEGGRAIYIQPNQKCIDITLKKWKKTLSKLAGGKVISKFVGDITIDLQILAQSHVVLCTPLQFESISRRWQQRKSIQSIELIIADDCHIVGSGIDGSFYEIVLNRFRYIATNLEKKIRFVALSSSIANYKDFADWLDVPKSNVFDFEARQRVFPLEVKFDFLEIHHNPSLLKCLIKPAYNHISNFDERKGEKNCLIFVNQKKDVVEIAKEFVMKLKIENKSWLGTNLETVQKYLEKVQDKSLKLCLKYGVGFCYSSMNTSDVNIVLSLFDSEVIKSLVVTKDSCHWAPSATSVLVLGTKEYEGKEHRFIDYTINEILEMIGLARKTQNSVATAIIYTNSFKLDYYKRFIAMPLPLESHLNNFIHDALVSDIKLIKNRQYAIDWITYSLFYRKLQLNPSYYQLKGTTDDELSEYLSGMIENTLNDLKEAGIVELDIDDTVDNNSENEEDDDDKIEIIPTDNCMIANHYSISYATMEILGRLNETLKMKNILELLCHATEFENVPIRENDGFALSKLYHSIPLKWTSELHFESPSLKVFILLQAYFSRQHLSIDFMEDLYYILPMAHRLSYALVDILSSQGYLNAMYAMDLCQMISQGIWSNENCLKQIPFFDDNIIKRCKSNGVKTVYDIMELEDDVREAILEGLTEKEVSKVADFVNKYPNLEVKYKLDGTIIAGESKEIFVEINRDEDVDDLTIASSTYPEKKFEHWWIVLGDRKSNELYSIKKLAIPKESQTIKIEFTIPEVGKKDLYIWVVSDSYIDADKQIEVKSLDVKAP